MKYAYEFTYKEWSWQNETKTATVIGTTLANALERFWVMRWKQRRDRPDDLIERVVKGDKVYV